MNKKIAILALALCMVAAIAITGTLAYFNDVEVANNVFTVGNVDIELTEPKWEEEGKEDGKEAYPGEALAKDPTVKNVGENPCFVRVKVEGLDQFVEKFGAEALIWIRNANYELNKPNADWTLHTDGYIYYNTVLESGKTTVTPAFSHIVLPTQITNDAATKDVVVTAQAVQAQGAAPSWSTQVNNPEYMTVEKIAAWFAQAYSDTVAADPNY